MYRIFGPKMWIVVTAYVAAAVASIFAILGYNPPLGTAVLMVQAIVAAAFMTQAWRLIWHWFPWLNRLVFPDLNGEWDVVSTGNYPRIRRLLDSAAGKAGPIDMEFGHEEVLPALTPVHLRATIKQSWLRIHIKIWDSNRKTPIEESNTICVQPIAAGEHSPPGLLYLYHQVNRTDGPADDRDFYGAARVWIKDGHDEMSGNAWTDRKWRRGMNTAATITLTKSSVAGK